MKSRQPLVEDIETYAQDIVDTVREPLLMLEGSTLTLPTVFESTPDNQGTERFGLPESGSVLTSTWLMMMGETPTTSLLDEMVFISS